MNKSISKRVGLAFGLCTILAAVVTAGMPAASDVTFTKDIAPIFYNRCVECHRPGEVAPMSLLTYQEARPWARSVKEKVLERSMPPWLASPDVSHRFENERRLSQSEINTLVAWADQGAPKGDDRDLPPAPKFEEGWINGKPDGVIRMEEEFAVPADGVVPYKYFTARTGFTEDKWIQAAEIRPGNRSVVHHIIVFIQDPNQKREGEAGARGPGRGEKLCGFAPGEQPKVFPKGTAKLVKAGSNLVFQMHYTPSGEATKDRSYVGLIFAKGPIEKKVLTATATNAQFVIPAGHPNYEVKSSWTAKEDVRIIDLMPHMHVRGKDFTYTAMYPDGRSEIVLQVPKYDFNWQLLYRFKEPFFLPKGSRLDCVAHFDNSAHNKYNPDPTKDVRWGDQTWEEMMIGWFDYVLDSEKIGTSSAAALKN